MPDVIIASCEELAAVPGLEGVLLWIAEVICSLGTVGVALLVMIETFFPPIPSEVILPLAGFVAALEGASVPAYIFGATVGSVVGGWMLYELGRWFGEHRIRVILTHLPLVEDSDFDKAQYWFDRYGRSAVLIGRCIPLVRSLISLPAGAARMPRIPFLFYTMLGSLVWNTLLISLGAVAGENWESIAGAVDRVGNIVVLVIVGVTIKFVWTRVKARKAPAEPSVEAESGF